MTQPSLSVVIPAFNEEDRLGRTLESLKEFRGTWPGEIQVVVVDDGSRDNTGAVVRDLAGRHSWLQLIRLPANRGKGYAVRTGILNAIGPLVLFADADGATPWGELYRLVRAIEGGADVAIGSRKLAGEGVTVEARPLRRLIGRTFHLLVSTLTVKGFEDTQCGFKLFRYDAAQDLFSRMRMDGFSFDVEVLLMAQRRGYRVAEVPINWVHQAGSRVNLVVDSLRMARDLFRIRSAAMRGDYDRPHVARLARDNGPETSPLSGPVGRAG